MKERGRKNIVIVVRDKKNNVWSHKNFIISWHKVVMKSFFLEAGPKNGRGLRQPLINLAQPPIFCPSFGYLPLEEWRGDWHSFHRMEISFYQRAEKIKKKWQIESENLVFATNIKLIGNCCEECELSRFCNQTVPIAII